LLGQHEEARTLFERLLSLRNDVGLLAEEYDLKAKRLVGNFPQALSHVALINTAHHLIASDQAESGAGAGEAQRDGAANAGGGAGDDNGSVA